MITVSGPAAAQSASQGPELSSPGTWTTAMVNGTPQPMQRFYALPIDDKASAEKKAAGASDLTQLKAQLTKALSTLATAHRIIGEREMTRMMQSRIGINLWYTSWTKYFSYPQLHTISEIVGHTHQKVDMCFRDTASGLQAFLVDLQREVSLATTEHHIHSAMQYMEVEASRRCVDRTNRVRKAFDKMCSKIHGELHIYVSPRVRLQMKYTLFALDMGFHYHPYPTHAAAMAAVREMTTGPLQTVRLYTQLSQSSHHQHQVTHTVHQTTTFYLTAHGWVPGVPATVTDVDGSSNLYYD